MDGFAVFPIVPNTKVPYAGSHGYKDASLDEDRCLELWEQHPEGVPAIACGLSEPRLIVLDVDPDKGGDKSLVNLTDKYGPLPLTQAVRTPRGGWHFRFLRPTDYKQAIKSSQSKIGAGLDIKADDGYTVAYPYDGDEPITEIPEWLFSLITAPKERTSDEDSYELQPWLGMLAPEEVQIGQRHDWLYEKACDLYPTMGKEMRQELHGLNRQLSAPKDAAEIDEIAEHVMENHIPSATASGWEWMAMDWREIQMVPQLIAMTDRQLGLWLRLRAIAWGAEPQGTIPSDHKLLALTLRQEYTEKFEKEDLPLILFEYRLDPRINRYVNLTMQAYMEKKKNQRISSAEGGRKARANDAKRSIKGGIKNERKRKAA